MRTLLLTLAVLLVAPAYAQDGSDVATDRSPENAQKFIQTRLPLDLSVLRRSTSSWTNDGVVEAVSSTEACVTKFSIRWPGRAEEVSIDWRTVDAANSGSSPAGEAVVVTQRTDYPRILHITYGTAESRNRVRAAMLYLKDACDPDKALGF